MDYVAHCVFRAALELEGPALELVDALDPAWIPLHDDAAERFFSARRALADSDRTAAARREGAAAARQFHDLLRRLPATKGSADDYMYRISLGLNVSRLSNAARATFAAAARRSLQRASLADVLTMPLLDWVNGRSTLEALFERIIGN